MTPTPCADVCKVQLDAKQVNTFIDLIEKEYDVHLILDNLPVARKYSSPDGKVVSKWCLSWSRGVEIYCILI